MPALTPDSGPLRMLRPLTRRPARATAPLLALALVAALVAAGPPAVAAGDEPAMAQAEVVLGGETFRVDVADTPGLQARGLGGRERLGPREGMLFVYADRARRAFWMLDMRIPIDIIWLDNRRVVHIAHEVPPPAPGTPPSELDTYAPGVPANMVLEIAAGRAAEVGLAVGQRVRFRFNVP